MKKLLIVLTSVIFVSCSTSGSGNSDDLSDNSDQSDYLSDESELSDQSDHLSYDSDLSDDFDQSDQSDESEVPDKDTFSGEFLGDFDATGKTCVTDIPEGRIMLIIARDYSDTEAPWRVYVHVLKDDGTVIDTEKYFETDTELRGIGFNSNGRLAALSSWKTGHVTLFALVDRTLCIAQEGIVLPNLKVNGDSTERVIFDEITADPNDPYRFYLTYGNSLKTSEYSNYSGGIYTMTVDSSGNAVIAEEHPQMHVPKAFTILPDGKKAIVIGGKEFITEEGSNLGSAGPDDFVILNIEGKTPSVVKWFDVWGVEGENSSGPSMKTVGVSLNNDILIANSSEYSDDPGLIKLFSYDGNETLDLVTTFSNDALDTPDYITLSDDGKTAVVLNSLFKGATLGIDGEDITYVKKETHDLTEPMIKLEGEPFNNHVLIHSFRSSSDESSTVTIAEITSAGLNEIKLTPVELNDDFSAQNIAVQ